MISMPNRGFALKNECIYYLRECPCIDGHQMSHQNLSSNCEIMFNNACWQINYLVLIISWFAHEKLSPHEHCFSHTLTFGCCVTSNDATLMVLKHNIYNMNHLWLPIPQAIISLSPMHQIIICHHWASMHLLPIEDHIKGKHTFFECCPVDDITIIFIAVITITFIRAWLNSSNDEWMKHPSLQILSW